MKAAVVVATIREDAIKQFISLWAKELSGHALIVVEDNAHKRFAIAGADVAHFAHDDIDADLNGNSWIVSRQTSAIKSYGVYKAWQMKPDLIVILDDDCYPSDDRFIERHYSKLTNVSRCPAWAATISGIKSRGVPFQNTEREVVPVLNHGLWNTNFDLDAPTQLVVDHATKVDLIEQIILRGMYFPLCGMNVAFKPQVAPLMYFGLQGQRWGVDRFDDIWCGVILQHICDRLGWWLSSGRPVVRHDKASDVWVNLRKEVRGLEINEGFWEAVDSVRLAGNDPLACFIEMADKLPLDGDYWAMLKKAMIAWASLFE